MPLSLLQQVCGWGFNWDVYEGALAEHACLSIRWLGNRLF